MKRKYDTKEYRLGFKLSVFVCRGFLFRFVLFGFVLFCFGRGPV